MAGVAVSSIELCAPSGRLRGSPAWRALLESPASGLASGRQSAPLAAPSAGPARPVAKTANAGVLRRDTHGDTAAAALGITLTGLKERLRDEPPAAAPGKGSRAYLWQGVIDCDFSEALERRRGVLSRAQADFVLLAQPSSGLLECSKRNQKDGLC